MSMRAGVAIVVLAVTGCSSGKAEDALPDQVRVVVERTKTTQATYALYSWNRIHRRQGWVEEWSAEFHSGHLHRVETPRDRLIADCQAGTGTALSVQTNETVSGPQVAMAACGVNTNKSFLTAEHLGVIQTPYGPANRIRVSDHDDIRSYDITANGAIVSATIAPNRPGAPNQLIQTTTALEATLPDRDMFSVQSLARSYVPDRLKAAPAR